MKNIEKEIIKFFLWTFAIGKMILLYQAWDISLMIYIPIVITFWGITVFLTEVVLPRA